jgi:hypothetical protein
VVIARAARPDHQREARGRRLRLRGDGCAVWPRTRARRSPRSQRRRRRSVPRDNEFDGLPEKPDSASPLVHGAMRGWSSTVH